MNPFMKPTPKRGSLGPGGWPEKITDQTLASPAGIQRLWEFALDREWVTADRREEFFALACCVSRLARDRANMKNPGGAFTTRLRDKDWLCASQADYAKARAILDGLARGIVAPQDRPAPPPAAPEVPREPAPIDLDARRRAAEQTRQLLLSRIGDSHQ
ncbi:MAG: hypothetical protein NT069_08235 [Planctomycetota bacterium]|nr:hypothetical protein [Planctomycetota bacterium]